QIHPAGLSKGKSTAIRRLSMERTTARRDTRPARPDGYVTALAGFAKGESAGNPLESTRFLGMADQSTGRANDGWRANALKSNFGHWEPLRVPNRQTRGVSAMHQTLCATIAVLSLLLGGLPTAAPAQPAVTQIKLTAQHVEG